VKELKRERLFLVMNDDRQSIRRRKTRSFWGYFSMEIIKMFAAKAPGFCCCPTHYAIKFVDSFIISLSRENESGSRFFFVRNFFLFFSPPITDIITKLIEIDSIKRYYRLPHTKTF
jgi:hypothetical protein